MYIDFRPKAVQMTRIIQYYKVFFEIKTIEQKKINKIKLLFRSQAHTHKKLLSLSLSVFIVIVIYYFCMSKFFKHLIKN